MAKDGRQCPLHRHDGCDAHCVCNAVPLCTPPHFFPSNTAVREAFLCEGQRDDEEMYARLSKATLEGPWGTFADGSCRGKLLSKMQVCSHMTPPPPPSHIMPAADGHDVDLQVDWSGGGRDRPDNTGSGHC
jgi:hypothetical protein